MIGAVAVTLQLAAAAIAPVTVRAGDRAVSVAVVSSGSRSGVRADVLALALGGSLERAAGDRYRLGIPGGALELEPGLPLARADTLVIPLVAAPWLAGGGLYVPLQLVTEIIPRIGTGFFYDVATREVRVFTTVFTQRPPPRGDAAVRADVTRVGEPVPRRRAGGGTRRIVVVDAGHGGPDNGMSGPLGRGPKIYEKNITLSVARLVSAALSNAGLEVVMTRSRDTLIALSDRGRIANRAHGDLFISIHVNAASLAWSNPSAGRGFETYFLAEAKTEDARRVEQMENESVRFETGANAPKGDPLSFIITDMAQNEHLRESNDLAENMQSELARIHPGPNRGVKQANFAVLRGSFMPAVLVEIGFGTNPDEAAFLASPEGQRKISVAIANAAVEYLARYEQRVGGAW